MHDVGVALDVHEVADFDGTVFADAAEIVAAEVDEHDVLGALFFVGEHFLFESGVFSFVFAARVSAGDGTVFELAAGGADKHFGGGAEDVQRGAPFVGGVLC